MRPKGREMSFFQRPEKDQVPWIFTTPEILTVHEKRKRTSLSSIVSVKSNDTINV